MKLNTDYLKATGLVIGALIWLVCAISLGCLFVLGITGPNFGFLALSIILIPVFVYATIAAADKLDLL